MNFKRGDRAVSFGRFVRAVGAARAASAVRAVRAEKTDSATKADPFEQASYDSISLLESLGPVEKSVKVTQAQNSNSCSSQNITALIS